MALPPAFAHAFAVAVAAVLGAGAMQKAWDLPGFEAAFAAYRLTPPRLAPGLARMFVIAEFASAGLLLAPRAILWGAALAAAVIAAATLGIVVNLLRGQPVACGCGGPGGEQTISAGLVIRNLVLLSPLLLLLGQTRAAGRGFALPDAVITLAAAAILVALYAAVSQLLANAHWSGAEPVHDA